jgi:hypothetical protein
LAFYAGCVIGSQIVLEILFEIGAAEDTFRNRAIQYYFVPVGCAILTLHLYLLAESIAEGGG